MTDQYVIFLFMNDFIAIDFETGTGSPESAVSIGLVKYRKYRPNGDIDTLLEQCKEKDFTNYCRKGEWHYFWIDVLNNDGNVVSFRSRTGVFRFVNKWKQEGDLHKYMNWAMNIHIYICFQI
jgi:hypothetical protein